MELLLERGCVDPDRPDNENRAPLWCAADRGHETVLKLLLERRGVDPNRADVNDITAPARASTEGDEGVVKLFREWEDSCLDSESDQDDGGSFIRFAPSLC